MNKKLIALSVFAALALPVMALAITLPTMPTGNAVNITAFIDKVFEIIWMVTATVVVIIFISVGFMFLTAEGDPAKVALARRAVIWGAVGVVVILLSFSVIQLVRMTFESNTLLGPAPGSVPFGGVCTSDADCVSNQCGIGMTPRTCN